MKLVTEEFAIKLTYIARYKVEEHLNGSASPISYIQHQQKVGRESMVQKLQACQRSHSTE